MIVDKFGGGRKDIYVPAVLPWYLGTLVGSLALNLDDDFFWDGFNVFHSGVYNWLSTTCYLCTVPGVGLTPVDKPDKDHVSRALSVARTSTASLGKFDESLPKEKPEKHRGKKRKVCEFALMKCLPCLVVYTANTTTLGFV